MSTIVNNPAQSTDSGSYGFFLGIIALIVFGALFYYFGIPAVKNFNSPQIAVPSQIVLPDQINVKVNQAN